MLKRFPGIVGDGKEYKNSPVEGVMWGTDIGAVLTQSKGSRGINTLSPVFVTAGISGIGRCLGTYLSKYISALMFGHNTCVSVCFAVMMQSLGVVSGV